MEEQNLGLEKKQLNSNKLKKRCVFLKIFLYQIYVCLFVVLLFLVLKLFFPLIYLDFNRKILNYMQDNSLNSFVNAKIESFKKKLACKKVDLNVKDKEDVNKKGEEKKQQTEENSNKAEQEDEKKQVKTVFEEDVNLIDEGDDVIFFNFKQPLKGRVSSKYGVRQDPFAKDKKDFHHGVDIAVCDGTPIVAIADGVVERTAKSERSGNFIFIKHGDFYESLYAHCSKILVPKGYNVKKGEKIALSGHSGNVTSPHLHLGIKKNGNWVDPVEVFPNLV